MRTFFRSRDNDGGHTIGSAIVEKPVLHVNLIEMELLPIEVFIARIGFFDLLLL